MRHFSICLYVLFALATDQHALLNSILIDVIYLLCQNKSLASVSIQDTRECHLTTTLEPPDDATDTAESSPLF